MAPLPVNGTGRVYIDYTGATGAHTTMLRVNNLIGIESAVELAQNFWDVARFLMTNEVNGAEVRFSANGSNFSLPAGSLTGAGEAGVNNINADDAAFVSFIGRTLGGRRTRVTLFNIALVPDADFSIDVSSTETPGGAVRSFLDSVDNIIGIDSLPVIWYTRANTGWNAYYQRKYRRLR